jgi:cysteinyl-tRNA synthetase
MIEVKTTVGKIEEFLRKIKFTKSSKSAKEVKNLIKNFKINFYKELDDDFNTPKAFAVMFEFINNANQFLEQGLLSKKDAFEIYKFFEEINKIFGFINFKKVTASIPAKIKKLANDREKYRKQQNWQKSDELRAEIEKHGFTIEDTSSGPIVKQL